MNELRQREPRVECAAFLAFVRSKPCRACGAPPRSEAAHLRIGCPARGKRSTGMQEKPSDQWANPLCAGCHRTAPDSQEALGERKFWARVGINPFENAERLWAQFCRRAKRTPEQRERVVKRAVRRKHRAHRKVKLSTLFRPAKSKPIKSANRWPAKGSRKIQGRGFR